MIKYLSAILVVFFLATACTAEVDEPVAELKQAVCTLPAATHTAFHKLVLQEISVPEDQPECFGLQFYSSSEPKRWRIDPAAPSPKKPSGQSCAWLSTPVLIPGTSACDFVRSFSCPYSAGTLVYHVFLTAASGPGAPKDPWSSPSYVMYIQDPSGLVWNGCTRTLFGPLPLE